MLIILMIAAALAIGASTPADLQLPTHWGIDGQPDQYSGKWSALLMPVAIVAGVSLLLYLIPAFEPRKQGLERSQGLYAASWAGMLLIGCMIQLAVASAALGWDLKGSTLILIGLGALFVLIGNQLGKSRSMFLIGIRTPWTLSSEDVWIKTHRLAGKLMVLGGLLLIVAAFLPLPRGALAAVTLTVLIAAVGVPLVYSFVLSRRERQADESNR
jgi:uncharacterized membrane protein